MRNRACRQQTKKMKMLRQMVDTKNSKNVILNQFLDTKNAKKRGFKPIDRHKTLKTRF